MYHRPSVKTIMGNISNTIAEYYETNTEAIPTNADSIVGAHPTQWRPVWKDKRRLKRIGITVNAADCFWHGATRCLSCNGEVEYCFNRRVETDKYKCPHCNTDSAIVIGHLAQQNELRT